MKHINVVLVLLFTSCFSPHNGEIQLGDIPSDPIQFQQEIIAQLSGEVPIQTTDGQELYINSRWTTQERKLTRKYLKAVIENLGLTPVEYAYKLPNMNPGIDLLIEPITGKNVFTTLPATETSEAYLVIGAHYDTGGKGVPGAIDNGSGMALILGVLRKVQQLSNRNKNLMVVFFDQEEEDISAGSTAFAKFLKATQVNIHSVHSFDLIGWDGDNNREIELELPSEEIENAYRHHAELLGIPLYVTQVNSSDHYSFIKEGFNAVGISQAYAKGDNSGKKDSPDDTYEIVNFEYLEVATNLAFEVIKDFLDD